MKSTILTYKTATWFRECAADNICNLLTLPGIGVGEAAETAFSLEFVKHTPVVSATVQVIDDNVEVYDFTRKQTFIRAWRRWAPWGFVGFHPLYPKAPSVSDGKMFPYMADFMRRTIDRVPVTKRDIYELHRRCLNEHAYRVARGIWRTLIVPMALKPTLTEWLAQRDATEAKGGNRL